MARSTGEKQGGGAEAERKAKKPSGNPGTARNTMGMGHKPATSGACGSMGKNQSTGDGGSANFNS